MKLFISYSRDDKAWVYELWRALRDEAQHDAWIDRRLVPAQDWWQTILENIEACECFVYVLTPKSVESIYCRAELEYALALNKPVLPLMLKPCDYPPALKHIQYQSISEDMNMDKVLLRVERGLNAVQRGLDRRRFTPPPSPHPQRPALPTPQRASEQDETFDQAEDAATANDFGRAEALFQQVIAAAPTSVLGLDAKNRLDDIRRLRSRVEDYQRIVRRANEPARQESAQRLARVFVANYGQDYDPDKVLAELLSAAETRVAPPPSPAPTESSWDRSALHRALDARLKPDELQQASFDLGLDYDNLEGGTKAAKARALILTLEQRGQLDRLVAWIEANRNDIDTSAFGPGRVGPRSETVKPAQLQTPEPQPRVEVVTPPPTHRPVTPGLGARITDLDGVMMVYVPPGAFTMGSTTHDAEKPPHEITLPQGFWLDLTPVTNTMYADFVKAGGYKNRQYWTRGGWDWVQANKAGGSKNYIDFTEPDQPRVGVTWFEAYAYCRWRGGRLPTEAEWEWAARGTENTVYPWGDDFDPSRVIFRGNSRGKTAVVNAQTRLEGASWVGALDMSGNVWEWTSSLFQPYPYDPLDGRETLEGRTEVRVLRGGSWNFLNADYLRAALRNRVLPFIVTDNFGFRCARSS